MKVCMGQVFFVKNYLCGFLTLGPVLRGEIVPCNSSHLKINVSSSQRWS